MSDQTAQEPLPEQTPVPPVKPLRRVPRLLVATLLLAAALLLIGTSWNSTKAARLIDRADMLIGDDPVQAHLTAERALKAWPTYPVGLVLMAQLEHRLKETKKAQELLRVAVEVSPSPGDSMYLLGSLLINEPDQLQDGLHWFELGMRLAPPEGENASFAWFKLAEAASKAGRHDLVIWAMLRAQKLGYSGEAGRKVLSQAYQAMDLSEMAKIALENQE